jgi:hypothetical protein
VYRIQIMNRTEATQTYRVSVEGIEGLAVTAPQASAGPVSLASLVVSLRLPHNEAQPLRGTSTPVVFEVATLPIPGATPPGKPAVQRERSTFFVPR